MTLGEKINAANAEALNRILSAQPTLIGVGTAGEDIPGMTKKTILHSGPPVTWENMCDPTKGAVIGALMYEGLAKTPEEAEKLAASGEITFDPCHHHNAVGPMCGIVSYSMPVWKVVNKTYGNMAYCTFNEGLGKVLRFGAYDETVITRLHWLRNEFYPVIQGNFQTLPMPMAQPALRRRVLSRHQGSSRDPRRDRPEGHDRSGAADGR